MRDLKVVLEGILGDLDRTYDVPDSISKLAVELKKLKFKRTYNKRHLAMYQAVPRDAIKTHRALWDIIDKNRDAEVKDISAEARNCEDCTIAGLVITSDDLFIIIGNPSAHENLLLSVQPADDFEEPPVIAAELQGGDHSHRALDFIMQSRQKAIYKFPGVAYEIIKSSIV